MQEKEKESYFFKAHNNYILNAILNIKKLDLNKYINDMQLCRVTNLNR